MILAATPFADGVTPFAIGLKPIDPARWIVPDERLDPDIAEKRELIAKRRDVVVRTSADSPDAEAEVLAMVLSHLTALGRPPDGVPADPAPIVRAALLVQDDLVLMRRRPEGWVIAAACLCFPSSWSLAEKFGQPLDAIHAQVPGYAGRMAGRVARIFDNLPAEQIVERFNWSIYDDATRHHPAPHGGSRSWADEAGGFVARAFLRVERQTLRRLPVSGDIVFTIRVHHDPVAAMADHPDRARLANGLAGSLAALDEAQLAYKGLAGTRQRMLCDLAALADGTLTPPARASSPRFPSPRDRLI
jgi:hypothetical protein